MMNIMGLRCGGVRRILAATVGVCVAVAGAVAQPQFLTSANANWTNSAAHDISATGQVAAMSATYNGTDGLLRAEFFSPNAVGFLPIGAPSGWFSGSPRATDATGGIVAGFGFTSIFGFPPQVGNRAWVWEYPSYNLYSMGMLIYADFSEARGMSSNGMTIVGEQSSPPFTYAVKWTGPFPYSVQDLGALPNEFGASANAVSDDGTTVVGKSGAQAFRWTSASGMVSLGSLPGQVWAEALGVNATGSVIVGIWNNGTDRGFRWTAATGMVNLPPLPGGPIVRPRAVSADGNVIVGQASDPTISGGLRGFVWTPGMGTQTAESHVVGRGLFGQLAGAQLTDVTSITPDSTGMCGNALVNGQPVGWAARRLICATIVPVPTTVLACPGLNTTIYAYGGSGGSVNGAVQFVWYRNNVPIVAGVQPSGSFINDTNTFALTIQGVMPGDAGAYHCVASSVGACVVTGPTTTLAMAAPPVIWVQPTGTTVCAGSNAGLSTAAIVSGGSEVYRWQKRNPVFANVYTNIFDGPTGTGATYSGTGQAALIIHNAQPGDSELYRCVASDTNCGPGNVSITLPAYVAVTATTAITSHPSSTAACIGDNIASMTVGAVPAGNVSYQWERQVPPFLTVYTPVFDGPTGNGGYYSGTQTDTLTLSGIFMGDMTEFRCVVTGSCGTLTSNSALFIGYAAPNFISHPTDQLACVGGTATQVGVLFGMNPGPVSLQWKKGAGIPLVNGPTGFGSTISGAQSQVLTITNFVAADIGQYYLEASAFCGVVNSLTGQLSACVGDADCDGDSDSDDVIAFFGQWDVGGSNADVDGDGDADSDDLLLFFNVWEAGC